MAHFSRAPDRRQRFLLPVDMMDWLPEDDIVYLIVDAVDVTDLSGFEATCKVGHAGQAPFAPAMMLALLIYAYSHGVRSSRVIERLCRRDAGYRFIVGDEVPDHSVIARFRRNAEASHHRRDRIPAVRARAGKPRLPGRGETLREGLYDPDLEPGVRQLGRGIRRRCGADRRYARPYPAPCHRRGSCFMSLCPVPLGLRPPVARAMTVSARSTVTAVSTGPPVCSTPRTRSVNRCSRRVRKPWHDNVAGGEALQEPAKALSPRAAALNVKPGTNIVISHWPHREIDPDGQPC